MRSSFVFRSTEKGKCRLGGTAKQLSREVFTRETCRDVRLEEELTDPNGPAIRPQYHFRPGADGFFAWDVARLIRLSLDLATFEMPLADIAELDELWWYQTVDDKPTPRSIAEHWLIMRSVDLSCPIILSQNGRVMDGMHRILKAVTTGHRNILARQFEVDPVPDHENYHPKI